MQAKVIRKLHLKVLDLAECSSSKSIKLRGIPEAVKQKDVVPDLQQLFLKLIPDLSPGDLLMDRAHSIPKPAYLPDGVPRDVLV